MPPRRFIFGLADSASFSAGVTLLIAFFGDRFATVFSVLQTSFAFGYAIGKADWRTFQRDYLLNDLLPFSGPFIGSLLYEAGGFSLPFHVFGWAGLVLTLANVLLLIPSSGKPDKEQGQKNMCRVLLAMMKVLYTNISPIINKTGRYLLRIRLQNPFIWLPCLDNMLLQWGNGFLEGMLEPFAKQEAEASQEQVEERMGLSQSTRDLGDLFQVGLAFLILGYVYVLCDPIQGQVRKLTPAKTAQLP